MKAIARKSPMHSDMKELNRVTTPKGNRVGKKERIRLNTS